MFGVITSTIPIKSIPTTKPTISTCSSSTIITTMSCPTICNISTPVSTMGSPQTHFTSNPMLSIGCSTCSEDTRTCSCPTCIARPFSSPAQPFQRLPSTSTGSFSRRRYRILIILYNSRGFSGYFFKETIIFFKKTSFFYLNRNSIEPLPLNRLVNNSFCVFFLFSLSVIFFYILGDI